MTLDIVHTWTYVLDMIKENIARAKGRLSRLVNSALKGEDVVLCNDGVPAVRLVPVRPMSGEDPCRIIDDLIVTAGDEAMRPLDAKTWGELAE